MAVSGADGKVMSGDAARGISEEGSDLDTSSYSPSENGAKSKAWLGIAFLVLAGSLIGVGIFNSSFEQTYYYCWNDGASQPHHLGYWVSTDHLCSWRELAFPKQKPPSEIASSVNNPPTSDWSYAPPTTSLSLANLRPKINTYDPYDMYGSCVNVQGTAWPTRTDCNLPHTGTVVGADLSDASCQATGFRFIPNPESGYAGACIDTKM
jgi:hypothetical protein